jgi:hypothetical protein
MLVKKMEKNLKIASVSMEINSMMIAFVGGKLVPESINLLS